MGDVVVLRECVGDVAVFGGKVWVIWLFRELMCLMWLCLQDFWRESVGYVALFGGRVWVMWVFEGCLEGVCD